jgi:hypothetical protein
MVGASLVAVPHRGDLYTFKQTLMRHSHAVCFVVDADNTVN